MAQKVQTFGTVPGQEFVLSLPRVEKYITYLGVKNELTLSKPLTPSASPRASIWVC